MLCHRKNSPIIMLNTTVYFPSIKDLISYLIEALGLTDSVALCDYELKDLGKFFENYVKYTSLNMKKYFSNTSQFDYVFLDISLSSKNLTQIPRAKQQFKLIIQLYKSIAPKTCENFLQLCKGFQ